MSSQGSSYVDTGGRRGTTKEIREGIGPRLLALEMEKGAISQGVQVTSRIWKRQGNASLEPPEGNAVLQIPRF